MESRIELGDFTLIQRDGKLFVAHKSLVSEHEIEAHVVIAWLKRRLAERVGL